jgi:hypothetical protein
MTVQAGSKLRLAKVVISARRKPLTRRNFKRLGIPCGVVSTAATIGVIHLDASRQALHGIPLHHHLHELVLDLPGRGLGDARSAAQLDAENAALALGQVIHGAKPRTQWHFGRGEYRSSDQGCLSSTGGALVQRAGLDQAVLLAAAHRADEARWPAPMHHNVTALILCSVKSGEPSLTEALLKLDLVARHRPNPQKQPIVPGLYPILMAEDSR